MSTVSSFLTKHGLIKTAPTVLGVAILVILSIDSPVYLAHATPTGGFWTIEAPRPGPANEGLGGARVGKTVFVLGGNNFACLNSAYDTTTNTWSARTPPPDCIVEPGGVVAVGGLIYLISGVCRNSCPPCPPATCIPELDTTALQIYNPTTDTWTMGAPIPTPRSRAGVSVYNGEIFVIGGYIFPCCAPALNVVEVYDIATNTWTSSLTSSLAPMPTAREGLLAATKGSNIFTFGGYLVPRVPSAATNVVEKYDITTNTWTSSVTSPTSLAPMPTARGEVNTMGGVACGEETVFVIGGVTRTGTLTNVNEAYLPSLNQWITRAPKPTPEAEGATGIVGSRLFVIGGKSGTNGNEAFECSNTLVGRATDSKGLPVVGVAVSVSGIGGLIGTVLTGTNGFFLIDVATGGTYTVAAPTLTGTVTTTVNVPTGTITVQNLSV